MGSEMCIRDRHMTLGDLVQASFIEDDGMKWLEDIKDLTP